ncbi:lysis system i-spanin subunit Rz [Rouxiella sp. T17]|uniref:lysis system i-spanin subunit Rz n=1 Tax=Rouxiella sp. T17 TaxID=3085684 RepID=UPI002FCB527A
MNLRIIVLVSSFIIGAASSWWIDYVRWEQKFAQVNRMHDEQLKRQSAKALEEMSCALEQSNRAQQLAAALDKKYTKELANALGKNERLKADVANGSRWVLFARADLATCQLAKDRASATGSVGNAAQVELSATAGRTVFAIREGIVRDQAKLDYLQEYLTID